MAEDALRGGIDLGGTKIQAIVADADNHVLGQARRPTPQEGGPPDVIAAIAEAIGEAAEQAGVAPRALAGIRGGAPGALDEQAGTPGRAGEPPRRRGPDPPAPPPR